MLHADARQQVAIERIARAEEPPGTEEPCSQLTVFPTPLPNGQRRVAGAEQGSDQAGQQIGQLVALSFLAARVRNGCEEFIEAAYIGLFQQLLALAIGQSR